MLSRVVRGPRTDFPTPMSEIESDPGKNPAPPPAEVPATPPPSAPPPNFEWQPPVIGTEPPPEPAAAAAPPPSRAPANAPATPKPVGPILLIATICAALAAGVFSVLSAQDDPRNSGAPYLIGAVIGGIAFWPGVILGLFSIFRRFRNARSRCLILLWTWSLVALALFGNTLQRSAATARRNQPTMDLRHTPSSAPSAAASAGEAKTTTPTPSPTASAPAKTTPAAVNSAVAATRYDFSAGSDARLIKQIESAQESTYADVVRAYSVACRERPNDALLALERVRFIERFAYAEDISFASAESDLAAAKEHLVARFPVAASTLLYQLEQLFGDEFNTKVDEVWPHIARWNATDRARFWLLRAQRANDDAEASARYAANAFAAEPSAEAALRHARGRLHKNDAAGARAVLMHPILRDAPEWQQGQQLSLLLESGAIADGVALFERLEKTAPTQVNSTEMAELLAKAGRIDLARRIYARIPVNKWNQTTVAHQRFRFELEHGTGEQAEAAYRALRDIGFETDSFARERAALLLKHPGAAWGAMEIGSLFALAFLFVFAALLPLAVLVPAHYWGLWRRSRGRGAVWTLSPWGLRAAWLVLGTLVVAVLAGLWWFQPETVRAWANESTVPEPARSLAPGELLGPPTVMWICVSVALLVLLLRARAWSLFGSGEWSRGKSIGLGLGLALLLKFCLGIYIAILGLEGLGMADVSPLSTQFFGAAYRTLGAFGFCTLVAVFVPLFEEVLFRGVLLGALAKHVPFWAANVLQSLAFVAVHDEMRVAPFFFAVGFVNGELVRRSRGLMPGIVLHIANNALACIVVIARSGN